MLCHKKKECVVKLQRGVSKEEKKYLINLILEKKKGVYLEEKENENINHLIISIKQIPRGSPSTSRVLNIKRRCAKTSRFWSYGRSLKQSRATLKSYGYRKE